MKDLTEKPKSSKGDVLHTITRAGLSGIPIIGGSAAEFFSALITPPLTKRRDEWVVQIAKRLQKLERKFHGFKIEDLAGKEMFITMVMQATQIAIRNHQKEKLEALQNAVLNAALPNAPEEDLQITFLHFIDTLTPWHLRILYFFQNPRRYGEIAGISYPNGTTGGAPATLLEFTFKELKGKRDFYDQAVKDLYTRGLMNIDSLHTKMTVEGMFSPRTTEMGKAFIQFITDPL